jgi:hypothetical protein
MIIVNLVHNMGMYCHSMVLSSSCALKVSNLGNYCGVFNKLLKYCFIRLAREKIIINTGVIYCHILTLEKESIMVNYHLSDNDISLKISNIKLTSTMFAI